MKVYILGGNISSTQSKTDKESFKHAEKAIVEMEMVPVNPFNHYYRSKTNEQNLLSSIELLLKCEAVYLLKDWNTTQRSRILKVVADEYGKIILNEFGFQKNIEGIKLIKDAVFYATGLRYEQYIIPNRNDKLVVARSIFIHLTNSIISRKIAEILSNRNQSTVRHAIKVYSNEYSTNKDFKQKADMANEFIKNSVSQ